LNFENQKPQGRTSA